MQNDYATRNLPFVIGTRDFQLDEYCGLKPKPVQPEPENQTAANEQSEDSETEESGNFIP